MVDTKKFTEQNRELELKHYGRLGMKWYQKIFSKYNDIKSVDKTYSKNRDQLGNRKKILKQRRNLSDADLKRAIERLQLEKTLKDAIERDIYPKKTTYKKAYSDASKKVLTTAATGGMTYLIRRLLLKSKNESIRETADFIAPGPKKK